MKKIILSFITLLFGVSLAGQLGGDGLTPGTAYYGTISSSQSWTYAYNGGIIYVGQTGNQDLTIGTGGSLSIEAGVTVKFCTTSSDLIITGTGTLTTNGTSSSKITFTRNYPSINYWGHISFESMGSAGTSLFNNCIIEYGDVSGNSSPASYGGGIYADFSNLQISNCTIQHNKAEWGGGIFVNANKSPSIESCYFFANYSKEGGGGIYLWNYTSSVIENCIFNSNHCDGLTVDYYTGGGLGSQSYGSIKVINCTFVNNTSSRTLGQSVMLFRSTANLIQNCIIWGNTGNHFYLSGTNTVQYCGVEGSVPSGTGNFLLSSNNDDPTGPNFTNPSSSDYSIKFISPCRDAGTSTGAPTTDYLGKSRIGPYDIGAYEVQYSRWNGTAHDNLWVTQSNWDATIYPESLSGTGDIIIPSGLTHYPTGDPNQGFVLSSGKYMILNPGAIATFGILRTSGTLKLESDASGISSLIITNANATATVELYLTGGGSPPNWHYISSPVSSLAASVFTTTTLDLAQYVENMIVDNKNNGWVAYDGWIYLPVPGHLGVGVPTFDHLNVGQGYNHYYKNDHTYTFTGILNSQDVSNIPLAYHSGNYGPENRNEQGFNLLGNPFSSCLDWSQIDGTLDPSISQAIYFNKNGSFASWNNGVGTNGGTGTIPPMQGFFVKTYVDGTHLTLPASARVHSLSQNRYKGNTQIIPLVRLKLENQTSNDDAVVRFDDKATAGVDNAFDAYNFSKSGTSIWTSTGGADFSINGLPFPETSVEIPVSVNTATAGNFKISGTQIDGLENYTVTLTDNVNNITVDLKTTPSLSFDAPGGTVAGRFVLKILTVTTAVPETTISDKPFNIYSSNGTVNIQTLSDTWNGKSGGIKILNMTGRVFTTEDNVVFSKDDMRQIPFRAAEGIYFVEIRSGVMRYVGKVIIR
jgi:hypothetical protein